MAILNSRGQIWQLIGQSIECRLHLFRSRVKQRGVLVGKGKAPTEDEKTEMAPRGHRNLTKVFGSYESAIVYVLRVKRDLQRHPSHGRVSPHIPTVHLQNKLESQPCACSHPFDMCQIMSSFMRPYVKDINLFTNCSSKNLFTNLIKVVNYDLYKINFDNIVFHNLTRGNKFEQWMLT